MNRNEKLDLLIEMNKDLQKQIQAQQVQIQAQNVQIQAQNVQIQTQQKKIDELVTLNIQIVENTKKMTAHIEFINRAYDKISKSYFFSSIFG
jgi:hypothetical protein